MWEIWVVMRDGLNNLERFNDQLYSSEDVDWYVNCFNSIYYPTKFFKKLSSTAEMIKSLLEEVSEF